MIRKIRAKTFEDFLDKCEKEKGIVVIARAEIKRETDWRSHLPPGPGCYPKLIYSTNFCCETSSGKKRIVYKEGQQAPYKYDCDSLYLEEETLNKSSTDRLHQIKQKFENITTIFVGLENFKYPLSTSNIH